jgi:hypothetical protein
MGLFGPGFVAQPATIELPPDVDLVAYYTEELDKAIKAHRKQVWDRRVRIGLIALVGIGAYVFFHEKIWWLWFVFGGGAAAADAGWKRRELTERLANTNDLRAISVLAVAARSGDKDTRAVARPALLKLLPLMQASNAGLLTDDGMNALVSLLNRNDPALLLNILKALEQVGDERALPAVEKLAAAHVPPGDLGAIIRGEWDAWIHSSNVSWEDVREAAHECLPYLQAKAEQKRNSETLLRAAQDPIALQQTLLRPAASTESPEDQLLRPVSS